MMGTTKLSTIRAKVRASIKKTDAELLTWFDQQIAQSKSAGSDKNTEVETLRLFRDALIREAKRRPKRATAGAKK